MFLGGRGWPHASQVCCDTPPYEEKTPPCSVFSSVAVEATVWRMGFEWVRLGSFDSKVSSAGKSQYTRLDSFSDE